MKPQTKDWWTKAFVTAGFVGYSPFASGTCGTVIGVLLYLVVQPYLWLHILLIVLLLVVGARLSDRAEHLFGEKDSKRIVVDEVMGFLVTMAGIGPIGWPMLIVAFLLNRVFDIWKPFPIRKLEDVPGGMGVMLDDLGAGIYSNLILRVMLAIF